TEAMDAKYELMERGGYIPSGYKFDPVVLNNKLPLEFFEARNAVRIAQSEGAEHYASDSYQHAVRLMDKVDQFATDKHADRKAMIAVAREVVQTAEDARAITVKKIDQERLDNERRSAANAQARTQEEADEATRQKNQAQSDQTRADKAKSDMADSQAASATALSAAQADVERSRLAAQQSQLSAEQAEAEKVAMRTKLSEQLNSILQTRDSARGLIVSMSDVVFDSGK